MTRYILHIGIHKTGTSSIQSFLANHSAELSAAGVDYPALGREPHRTQAHRYFAYWFRGKHGQLPAEFATQMASGFTVAPNCIISSEGLYMLKSKSQFRSVQQFFGEQTKVVCFLRDPVSHVVSLYKEKLKRPTLIELSTFMEEHRQSMMNDEGFSYYSYDLNLARWRDCFDVSCAVYDGLDVVNTFLRLCNLYPSSANSSSPTWENRSLSNKGTVVQFSLNRCLREGLLSQREWGTLTKAIKQNDPVLPDLAGCYEEEEISVCTFANAFRERNREYGHLAKETTDRIQFPALVNANHFAILEEVKHWFSETLHVSVVNQGNDLIPASE